jgi:cytochrome o ubiquinol oxidase subunit 2
MNARVQYLFLLLMVAGCTPDNISFLNPQGPIAAAQRWHFVLVSALVMLVVLPVLVLTPLVAWRYRRKNQKARYTPKWDFSMPVEFAIWGIPVAIVAVLVVLLWRSTAALDPYSPLEADKPPLRVQVVGLDWKWLFIYPDEHIATVGVLAFSADRPLALELTSDSVMQSFFIPALGGQIYAMAGMVTKLHLAAFSPGVFTGENTQFSGTGFHRQKFTAVAMHRDKFAAWVEKVRTNGISLDEATYRMLARKSTPERANEELGTAAMPRGVLYFTDVPSGLFATIVDKYRYGRASEETRDQVRKGAAPLSSVLVTGRETRQ